MLILVTESCFLLSGKCTRKVECSEVKAPLEDCINIYISTVSVYAYMFVVFAVSLLLKSKHATALV